MGLAGCRIVSLAATVQLNMVLDHLLVLLMMSSLSVVTEASANSLCSSLELPPGAYLSEVVGNKAFYSCGNHKAVAICVERKWVLPTSNCLKAVQTPNALPRPQRRSPGVYSLKVSRKRRARSGRRRGSRNRVGPRIALDSPPLVVVRTGEAASMMCRVENLGSHSITWTRVANNKVIAIDTNVLVGDPRVIAKFEETLGSILQVGHTNVEDQGEYECQVSTRPPLRYLVDLQVLPHGEQLLLPPEPTHSKDPYDFLLRNMSAVWTEVGLLRKEVQHHLHGGNNDQEYNRAMDEISVMHHENVVHNHHRAHKHHNLHHNTDLLQHMVNEHGHHHTHQDEGEGHREHNHHHEHQLDIHDHQGLHEHEGEHDDFDSHENLVGHDQHSSESDDHHDHHDHDDDRRGSHGGHAYDFVGGRDLQSAYANQESGEDDDDDDDDSDEHSHNSRSHSDRQQASHDHGSHSHGNSGHNDYDDLMMTAFCDLMPNKDMPTSNVRGEIIISQRKDKKGPVYFDLDLEGFDVQRDGYLHGFHIHAQAVTRENQCGAAKGHFNPFNVNHGGQKAQTRHVGDLGNIRVDEDGELEGYILSDNQVAFVGDNAIIGKSIVVHAGEDDLGLGGAPDSLTTGAAGGRLACCNIYMQPQPRFRIKG